MPPILGTTVMYKSKIDNGPGNDVLSPAIIVRTKDTTVAEVIDRWAALAPGETMTVGEPGKTHVTGKRPPELVTELPSDEHVDLCVFGLGKVYWEYCVPKGDDRGQWNFQMVPGYR